MSSIFASPMPAHVMSIFLTGIFNFTILHPAEAEVGESAIVPGAVVQRRSLADGSVTGGDAIYALRRSRCTHEISVEGTPKVPSIVPRRHG